MLFLSDNYQADVVEALKDIDYCPIEIIKGLTDKGEFQYLTKLMGPQEGRDLPVYNTLSFTKIEINMLS